MADREFDAVPLSEVAGEGFRRLRAVLGFLALLVDHAAHELLHRDTDLSGLAFQPRFVRGIDVPDCDAPTYGGTSSG